MGSLPRFVCHATTSREKKKTNSFNAWHALQREASDYFLYYSGPLSDWQDDLMNDVAPMDKFVLPNTLGQDLGAQVWFGSRRGGLSWSSL